MGRPLSVLVPERAVISPLVDLPLGSLSSLALQECFIHTIREVCWFITLFVEGIPVNFLLDTGASRTLFEGIIAERPGSEVSATLEHWR